MILRGRFYYSQKQRDMMKRDANNALLQRSLGSVKATRGYRSKWAKLDDGRMVEYTEMIGDDYPEEAGSNWDDAVLLGNGKFDHFGELELF